MRILTKQNIEDLVFLDIETTYDDPEFSKESPMYSAWRYDFMKQFKGKDPEMAQDELGEAIIEGYFTGAALDANYGRIICITMGVVRQGEIYLKTFSGEEKDILEKLNDALDRTVTPKSWLVGHTIIGFDGPYIARRCMINRVPLHNWFDVAHLKPWEVPYLDISALWKGTGFKPSSLLSMCSALGVPSPKEDISGAEVPHLFHKGEIKRIITYCEKDVVAVVQCFRALCNRDFLDIAPGAITIEADILTYLMSGGRYTDEVKETLTAFLKALSKTEREKAFTILEAIPTKAKGKATDFDKKHIKELKEVVI